MLVNIKYFAALKDSTNIGHESIETKSKTANDLFEELHNKYNFSIDKKYIKVAINESYQSFDSTLNPNDTIVFIPPVTGG